MQRSNGYAARMEAACHLLASPARRYLLYQLAEAEHASLDELVPQIAAWKAEKPIERVAEEERRTVRVSLVHNHLPRLADHDVVEYDLRSGDVVLADGFSDLESLLRQFRETEDHPELRNLSVP